MGPGRRRETISLARWVDQRQSQGRYSFHGDEAVADSGLQVDTFRKAAARLASERRIARIRAGFYVIVPLEYRAQGITPPDWFISDLMAHLGQPYYVGLLSASAYYGAAHQRAQQYQVVTDRPMREIRCHTVVIRFFKKDRLGITPRQDIKTATGFVKVSSPEATALDLVAYARHIGGLDRVLTLLQELGERLDPAKLVESARRLGYAAYGQRLGWLLEQTAHADKTGLLADWVSQSCPSPTLLHPSVSKRGSRRERRWNLWINTDVKGDLD